MGNQVTDDPDSFLEPLIYKARPFYHLVWSLYAEIFWGTTHAQVSSFERTSLLHAALCVLGPSGF